MSHSIILAVFVSMMVATWSTNPWTREVYNMDQEAQVTHRGMIGSITEFPLALRELVSAQLESLPSRLLHEYTLSDLSHLVITPDMPLFTKLEIQRFLRFMEDAVQIPMEWYLILMQYNQGEGGAVPVDTVISNVIGGRIDIPAKASEKLINWYRICLQGFGAGCDPTYISDLPYNFDFESQTVTLAQGSMLTAMKHLRHASVDVSDEEILNVGEFLLISRISGSGSPSHHKWFHTLFPHAGLDPVQLDSVFARLTRRATIPAGMYHFLRTPRARAVIQANGVSAAVRILVRMYSNSGSRGTMTHQFRDWVELVLSHPYVTLQEFSPGSLTVTTPSVWVELVRRELDEFMENRAHEFVWIRPVTVDMNTRPARCVTPSERKFLEQWMSILHAPRRVTIAQEMTAVANTVLDITLDVHESFMSNFYIPESVVIEMMQLQVRDGDVALSERLVRSWVAMANQSNRFSYTPHQLVSWYMIVFGERPTGTFFAMDRDTELVEEFLVPRPRLLAELIARVAGAS